MNKFTEMISNLKDIQRLKESELEKLQSKQTDIKSNLIEYKEKEQNLKKEIEEGYHRKEVLENYRKLYWNKVKIWVFLFLGIEPLGIGMSVLISLITIPSLRSSIIVAGIIMWNLLEFPITKMIINEQTKEIHKIKKSYKLEEVISKIHGQEQELGIISQKIEESKNTLNELDIQVPRLENELQDITENLSKVAESYKETFKRVTQTIKIEELRWKYQHEIDFELDQAFEQKEKRNEFTLKNKNDSVMSSINAVDRLSKKA